MEAAEKILLIKEDDNYMWGTEIQLVAQNGSISVNTIECNIP